MKKSFNVKRTAVSTLALVTLLSASVVAANAAAAEDPTAENKPLDNMQVAPETIAKYGVVESKVSSVSKNEDGSYSIEMGMDLIANIESGFVLDQKTKELKGLDFLEEGMEVIAILDNLSPQTLSLPPMTNGVAGFIVRDAEAGSIEIANFDSELVNNDNSLMLNISEDTMIASLDGTKKVLTSEDVRNSQSIVLYSITTRSIPAQTNPEFIFILDKPSENKTDVAKNDIAPINETEEGVAVPINETGEEVAVPISEILEATPVTVPLRDIAVENGYEVKWVANDKPVLLTKADKTIEVVLGSNKIKVNGEEKVLAENVSLTDEGAMVVSSSINDYLK